MMELRGKRKKLLKEVQDMEKFRMQGKVMEIYDDRGSAKETLQLFRENGWIEIETHGVFSVTEEGREAFVEDSDDSPTTLDKF